MKFVFVFLLFSTLFASVANASQQVYYWKDASGISHFSSNPPASVKHKAKRLPKYESATPAQKYTPKKKYNKVSSSGRYKYNYGGKNQRYCNYYQKEMNKLIKRLNTPHPEEQTAYFQDFESAIQNNIDRFCG